MFPKCEVCCYCADELSEYDLQDAYFDCRLRQKNRFMKEDDV